MIVIMYEDFPDQVLPHLCCRNSSGQEKLLREPPELCYDTWQEWLPAGMGGNTSYSDRFRLLDLNRARRL